MRQKEWERVQKVFQEALPKSLPERDGFLEQACGGDSDLRRQVVRLLEADQAEDTLSELVSGGLELLQPDTWGGRIGPYRLLRPIGRGGMGEVYLAERADLEFDKKVALKLIRLGMTSPETVERFRRERQILADLEHPNIARLLDGGTVGQELPYLVMEYVQGEPIDLYCNRQRLAIRRRIELFLVVCEAVAYAHRNLIVHRDLKPANILVTDQAAVKLLDFGIAKLINEQLWDATEHTETSDRPFTLSHASPEQIRGERAGTASDVYSLGAVLYQLLTGFLPHQISGLSAREAEIRILEGVPVEPSRLVSSPPASALPDIRRGHELQGDLDNILTMALRKDPRERYRSVDQLGDDLRRYLGGRPVLARAPTLAYRTSKFVRRNPLPLAIAAAFILLVVFSAAALMRQSALADQQATLAGQERDKANELLELMIGFFEGAGPDRSKGETITAREILDRAEARIPHELKNQPETQIRLLNTIARLYRKLGAADRALPLVEQALRLSRGTLGESHIEVGKTLNHLGKVYQDLGEFAKAERLFRESLSVYGTRSPETRLEVAEAYNDLALALQDLSRIREAEPILRQALELYRQTLGEEDPRLAVVYSNLGLLMKERGRFDEAEELIRRALAINRNAFRDTAIAADLDALGSLLADRRQYAQAARYHREALEAQRRVLGDDHPRTLGSFNNLAVAQLNLGQYKEAERLFGDLLDRQQHVLGEDHVDVATTLHNLALSVLRQGRYRESESFYRRALEIRRKRLGAEHLQTVVTLEGLASTLKSQNKCGESEPLFYEVLRQKRRILGEKHVEVAWTLRNIAYLLQDKLDYREAEDHLRRALEMQREAYGQEYNHDIASTLRELGTVLGRQNRLVEAEAVLRGLIAWLESLSGSPTQAMGTALTRLGAVLSLEEKTEESEQILRRALGILESRLPAGHWRVAATRSVLGGCLTTQGRYDQAEPMLLKSYEVLEKERGAGNPYTQRTLLRILRLYESWGRNDSGARLRADGRFALPCQ